MEITEEIEVYLSDLMGTIIHHLEGIIMKNLIKTIGCIILEEVKITEAMARNLITGTNTQRIRNMKKINSKEIMNTMIPSLQEIIHHKVNEDPILMNQKMRTRAKIFLQRN